MHTHTCTHVCTSTLTHTHTPHLSSSSFSPGLRLGFILCDLEGQGRASSCSFKFSQVQCSQRWDFFSLFFVLFLPVPPTKFSGFILLGLAQATCSSRGPGNEML